MIYLAYGSNLNVWQMKRRCPDARIIGAATLKGYELLFKGSKTGSYLTIEKMNGGVVPVGVWEVSDSDILNLDRYEGFPTFYYKRNIRFRMHGTLNEGLAYIMHEDRQIGIPSAEYLKTCIEGYESFGFEYTPLMKAVIKSEKCTGKVVI